MKFSTREDIDAPIRFVFERLSNFDEFERQGLRRGAEITRLDDASVPGVGAEWRVKFTFRGKKRELTARITEFEAPTKIRAVSESSAFEGDFSVDLIEMAPKRTRMQVSFELQPRTLASRLLMQSLKLARSNLNRRFTDRARDYAKEIEAKYRASTGGDRPGA